MSAPRPYETDPFHPHSSVHIQYEKQFLYIYARVFQLFVPCGIHIVSLCVVHFPLPMLSSTSSYSKVQSPFSPLVFYLALTILYRYEIYMLCAHEHFPSREIVNYPE